jgi:hypothetical protein
MVTMTITLRVQGAQFSPDAVERDARVVFSQKVERGTLATRGRYAGQATPYGSAELVDADPTTTINGGASAFLDSVERVVALEGASHESAELHILVAFVDQCNFELAPEFVQRVARMKLPITISCFEDAK